MLADLSPDLCAELAQADAYEFCRYLLDRAPKLSSAELKAELERLGGPVHTKALIKRWRDEIKGEGWGEDAEPKAPDAAARFADAVKLGDGRAAVQWARAEELRNKAGIAIEADEDPDALDLSGLSEVQFSAYHALVSIARGVPMTDEVAWWVALFARVPAALESVHPAHVPLPEVERTKDT